mgnify:CR=1 FL=1
MSHYFLCSQNNVSINNIFIEHMYFFMEALSNFPPPKQISGAPQEYFHFLIASRHRSTSCFLAHFAPRKQCRSRKLGRKWKIHLQVTDICLLANSATPPHSPSLAPALRSYASHPPFPFATSEFKNK